MARACEVFKEQDKSKVPLKLALREEDGSITLMVVDENGTRITQGNILVIDMKTGKFTKSTCVNPAFGLDLDDRGSVIFE